jgi:hypothetical protein
MGTKYIVQIEVSRKVMLDYWGHPCQEADADCPSCKAWRRWKKTKKITVTTSEENTLKILLLA